MKIIEFGDKNNDTVMMLHGGGLSWWNYREEAKRLSDKYYIVLPIIDGHAGSDGNFISIEDNAKKLVEYIRVNLNGKVKALCGLSLGAQIAVEMISQCGDICEYAVIESVSLVPSKITEALIRPMFSMSYGLIKKKWFSKLQFNSLHINETLYDDYYHDTCKITKENMISFLKENTKYSLRESVKDSEAVVKIIVGSKEQKNMIKSAQILSTYLKNSTLVIKEGLFHGEYSLNKADEYVTELLELMSV